MEHSAKFYRVQNYYDNGVWNKTMVHNAVDKNWITKEEYKEIMGEDY